MAEIAPNQAPAPWVPETDPRVLKVLGKAGEEGGEMCSAISRCIIQGIEKAEPVTGKVNRRWLEEEIADVEATIEIMKHELRLDREFIRVRRAQKYTFLTRWLPMGGPS